MSEGNPQFVAGCRMPSNAAISAADKATYAAAQDGSERLLAAILRLFSRMQKETQHG